MRILDRQNQFGRERGAALIMIVGLVAVMAGLVAGIQYEISRSIAYVQSIRTDQGAKQMAEVGLSAALILLKYDHEEDVRNNQKMDYYFQIDEEDDSGLAELSMLQNAAELWSMFSPMGYSPFKALGLQTNMLPIGIDGGVELTIEDESSKWNFHRLLTPRGMEMNDPEVKAAVGGLLYSFEEEDPELARGVIAAGIDWMDANDQLVDTMGAERFYYQELPNPYEPRNGPFQHREELRALANVDESIYQTLISSVTVWPNDLKSYGQYKININTAPPEVLSFLHPELTTNLIDIIIEDREEGPFQNKNDLGKLLQQNEANDLWAGYGDRKKGTYVEGILERNNFDVHSRAFLVRSTGFTLDGEATLEAVIDRDYTKGTLRVLSRRWRHLQ